MRLALAIGVLAGCGSPEGIPDAALPWTAGPALPRLALEPGVAAIDTHVVVLGGFDTNLQNGLHITTRVDSFDTIAQVWSTLPDAPVAWTHLQLAGADGALYVLGGLAGQEYVAHGEAFVLAAGATAWRPLAAMPAGLERGAAAVVTAPSHVYLLGGASSAGALATGLDYNLTTDTWTRLPDLPAARSHPAAIRRADGALIVAGGLATLDAADPTREVWLLPVGGTAWESRTAMPTARGGCAYATFQDRLVCAGGEAGQAALHIVEVYDPTVDAWTALPEIPVARAGTQGVAIGDHLYVPGGAQTLAFEPTDTLFVFSPHDTADP